MYFETNITKTSVLNELYAKEIEMPLYTFLCNSCFMGHLNN
jgi:hypothetical protein